MKSIKEVVQGAMTVWPLLADTGYLLDVACHTPLGIGSVIDCRPGLVRVRFTGTRNAAWFQPGELTITPFWQNIVVALLQRCNACATGDRMLDADHYYQTARLVALRNAGLRWMMDYVREDRR